MNLAHLSRTLGMTLAAGAIALTAVPAASADTAAAPTGCFNGWIGAWANNRLVSAELHWEGAGYGALRARTVTAKEGNWEQFEICLGSKYDTIRSLASSRYVAAELDYTGAEKSMLRARSTTIGPWEEFDVVCRTNSYCTIKSLANNKYVSVADSTALRADSTSIGWEQKFGIERQDQMD
ncbi:hypothetical protein AB0C27_28200 [Nonomuraea sp. NPDC048882]|uniref:fascin domain-containing protein n=1 Tax=Nonomuraea sp. NPDC048882 TaxID=3154347 RepID=UPI0033C2EE2E